jgi:hypothetical protein
MGRVSLFLILVGLLKTGNLSCQPAAATPVALEPAKPLERDLRGGETHTYEINLVEGQYARVAVEQRGVDVLVRVEEAGAKGSIEFDSEIRLSGEETAELVAEAAGACKLHVQAKYKALAAGRYAITLAEVRPAGDKDRSLQRIRTNPRGRT